MNIQRSKELFEVAQKYLPGGVDSPVSHYLFKGVKDHIFSMWTEIA